MSVKFSKEQLRAIETLDKSVLVSAAAGSGKTAVLVERILRIILDGKANVDEMLIVTFTKAAAAEMKSRLSSAIRKQIAESPDDAKRLSDQLARMYRAYITTIDSFAMRVIREFFYEIDMEPDFGACDEVQGELMRREALQELIDAGFEDDMFLAHGEDDPAGNVGFREFLRLYSEERQEDTFKDRMLSAYSGLRSVPDYFEWAYNRAELLKAHIEVGNNIAVAPVSDLLFVCFSQRFDFIFDRLIGFFICFSRSEAYKSNAAHPVHEFPSKSSGLHFPEDALHLGHFRKQLLCKQIIQP